MVLLVFVHGYNLNERYLQPWSIVNEPLSITTFIEYFLANGIFRFRIPMLFAISGYLFAYYDFKPRKERILKRFKTLAVPYIVWSAMAIGLCLLLELIPYTKQLIVNSHVLQIDETKMLIQDYAWYEVVGRWIFFPVAYQLWFIRVLFIYNLAYPIINWCVTNTTARWIFFAFAAFLWLATFGTPLIEGEGLLFFASGVWLQKSKINLEQPIKPVVKITWLLVFVLLSGIKTALAIKGFTMMGNSVFPVLTLLHKAVIVTGFVSVWINSDKIVEWFAEKKWFNWLSQFSFFIYALHAPFIAFAIDWMFQWLQPLSYYRAATFVLLPLLIITLCVSLGALVRKLLPRVYSLLTGGRGL
jgi:fucose 4-O-acetylase-like acetyltransferase